MDRTSQSTVKQLFCSRWPTSLGGNAFFWFLAFFFIVRNMERQDVASSVVEDEHLTPTKKKIKINHSDDPPQILEQHEQQPEQEETQEAEEAPEPTTCEFCQEAPCVLQQGLYDKLCHYYTHWLEEGHTGGIITNKEVRFALYRQSIFFTHGHLHEGTYRASAMRCHRHS